MRTTGKKRQPKSGAAGPLGDLERRVARHYSERVFQFELTRLTKDSPVEFAMMARLIRRFVPAGCEVAEIGIGGGHYSELLARWNCFLTLVDITDSFLSAAEKHLKSAGLSRFVRGLHRASATDLSVIPTGAMDAVLFLGPLYHLHSLRDRRRALAEAARILKKGGVILAAGINRLSYLRELLREDPEEAFKRRKFHARYLRDGNLNPRYAPPIGFGHMTTVGEFRQLFRPRFKKLELIGVESFAAAFQKPFSECSSSVKEAWLDLIEQTGRTPEGLGQSDHFFFIGRKRR